MDTDLTTLEQNLPKLKGKIKDNKFTFDKSTTEYKMVYLGNLSNKKKDFGEDARATAKRFNCFPAGLEEEVALTGVEFVSEQPNLKYLNINFCGLTKLTIKNCPNLETLYVVQNQLEEIKFEGTFENLKLIDLTGNRLTKLELSAKKIPKLRYLYLADNQLKDLSGLAGFFTRDTKKHFLDFSFEKNPLVEPPEAITKQGKAAIANYFRKIEQEGKDYIYEAKLLILGDPRAGKTTLARKILKTDAPMPTEDETTRGIELGEWNFEHTFTGKGKKNVRINIWDFGGQTIYKQTHRFFLTQRSFYIILSDGGSSEKTDFKYWLHSTKIFGKNSPVVVFINEKEYRTSDVPFETFRKINTFLKAHTAVNLQDAAGKDRERFNKTIDLLKSHLVSLEHLGEAVPKSWKAIREALLDLEQKGKKEISLKQYREICKDNGVTDRKTQNSLSRYFHDIGIFLHFHENDMLQRYVFLNKQWVLNGAYKVVDSKEVESKKGKLCRAEFNSLFSGEYEDYRGEMKELLKVFYLIYEKDDFYVIPQHLPKEAPEYEWNEQENLQFIYDYDDYMPAGILWQFMVEMNARIKNDTVWRYGVVLDFEGTLAEVKEEYGKDVIKIRVQGIDRRDFRAVVLEKIDEINQKYDELPVNRKVPCICDECNNKNEPHFYNYSELTRRQAKNKPTVECAISFKNVSVEKLLSGVELKESHKIFKEPHPHTTYIKKLIANGKTERAIQEFLAGTEACGQKELKSDIGTVSGNYQSAKNRRLKKITTEENFIQAQAQANDALSNFLNEYAPKPDFEFDEISDEELEEEEKVTPTEQQKNVWKKTGKILAIIAAIIAFLAAVAEFSGFSLRDLLGW